MKFKVVAALSLCAASTAYAAQLDPYAQPKSEFEQRLQLAMFGAPGADRALQEWVAAHPELPEAFRSQAFGQLCRDYGFFTWNKLRARLCAEYSKLKKSSGGDDDEGMALAFADEPSTRAVGSAKVPLTWNAFGSQSIDVEANGVRSTWFFDTGAEITVVTQSLADRMEVRPVGSGIRVGTTTSDVTGKVGIIDVLKIGTAFVENVPVLILPDAQLKLGNVHQIDGILGIQPMVAFGRVAWVDGGRFMALGEAAPKVRPGSPKIYWHEEGVGVPVGTDRGLMGAFLDTGANASYWRRAGLPLLDPMLIAKAREKTAHVGGAGGVVERKQRELPSFEFRLGRMPVRLTNAPIQDSDEGAAWIGMDAVSQFGTFILDFEQMRVDGRLKTAAERKATHKTVLTQKDVQVDDKPK